MTIYERNEIFNGAGVLADVLERRLTEEAIGTDSGGRGDFGADRRFCRRNQDAGRGAG